MNYPTMKLTKIKEHPQNPRQHTDEQIKKIAQSIKELGWGRPLILSSDGYILAGHGAYQAARDILGYTDAPIKQMKHKHDSPEALAYMVADNKLTDESDWNYADLELVFEDIKLQDYDVELTGFNIDEQLEVETKATGKVEVTEDDFDPESVTESTVQSGQVWQLGSHRLMCGDSTITEDVEQLMNGNKADLVFTDPPYGMSLDTDYSVLKSNLNTFGKNQKQGNKYDKVIGDNEDFHPDLILNIFDHFNYCNEIFLWGADYYHRLLPHDNGSYFVWDKRLTENLDKGYGSGFELCWSNTKHKRDIIRVKWFGLFGTETQDIKKRIHPTQKPLELCSFFIDKYSKLNDLIVDVYGGSGSTLIACEQLQRQCYMMELDPHYCDVIIKRWEDFTGLKAELIT